MDELKEEIHKIVKNMIHEEYIKNLCGFAVFLNYLDSNIFINGIRSTNVRFSTEPAFL